MKLRIVLFLLTAPLTVMAQSVTIIPQPASITLNKGNFTLKQGTVLSYSDPVLASDARYLKSELAKSAKINLRAGKATINNIRLTLTKNQDTAGSYRLSVSPQHIVISSASSEGIFYGIQSLLQLVNDASENAKQVSLQALTVHDAPRYPWRGFMLDESRHFFGKQKVEMLLDWMARYKLNKFHWHLTDAHGWRIQIKQYPRLTTVGGIGNYTDSLAPAKYYTQDDIREIVEYARKRFIIVIPEIDMPGHATAANKAYPEYSGGVIDKYPNFTFNPAKEETYTFLANIIKETNRLFPSHLFHLGGDEVAYGMQAWLKNPAITDMMKSRNFATPNELEFYFFKRMADTVVKLGDKVLCWDEATDADLPADKTIIFWWRQNKPEQLKLALQKNYQVVLCPRLPMYFDFVQDSTHISGRKWDKQLFNTYADVYNFPDKQMDAADMDSKNIIGVQANIWTETVGSEKRLDYLLFPRLAALAEAAWDAKAVKDIGAFSKKLSSELKSYQKAGIYYYDPGKPMAHPEAVDFAPKKGDD